jgi:deoxyribodipyrimidine photo-lyase
MREDRSVTTAIMWFRRDLRLADNPALTDAFESADTVVPIFVLDPRLWGPAGPSRRAYQLRSLSSLSSDIGGLVLRSGDPVDVVAALADETGATGVHVAADFGPYGSDRDSRVEETLQNRGVQLARTGSAFAVAPGRVVNQCSGP